jgi:hypothetical protein
MVLPYLVDKTISLSTRNPRRERQRLSDVVRQEGAISNGIYQTVEILDNYGIDSETDVSLVDPNDLSKLVSRDLKPLDDKKFQNWFVDVCTRTDNM